MIRGKFTILNTLIRKIKSEYKLIQFSAHKLITLSKFKYKEKIFKEAREKQQITYKRIPIGLTSDLAAETRQARREWQDIFKVMKEKNLQAKLPSENLIQI